MMNNIKSRAAIVTILFWGLVLVACSAATGSESAAADNDGDEDIPVPATTPRPMLVELTDLGPAPEITNEIWINQIRYKHIGEFSRSARAAAETAIQQLMIEPEPQ